MAATLSPKPSGHHFSISNIIPRFRSRKKSIPKQNMQTETQAEPQIILQDTRSPLIAAPLPLVLPEHQQTLSTLGWTTVTFPSSQEFQAPALPSHPLQTAYKDLFAASQAFFALPDSEKQQWKHKLGSEEGWSKIPGEKEFIALRTLEYCPEVLRGPATIYWHLVGAHCAKTLGRVSASIGLPDEALTRFVGPCGSMPDSDADKTATMLRLFRYEGWDAKVVAEPHGDLGLLSVVVGNVPGLEVWDAYDWFPVEKVVEEAGRKGATLLVGRQLERLSNGRYPAGGHRVVAYGSASDPASVPGERQFRYSIVFVLRAHEPVVIDSDSLETEVTGKWGYPLHGITAGQLYKQINGMHFNINIGVEEREKQRRKLTSG
ncbi:Clavaminate synthase-like protein [Decorospora gaudefroyi]|uniref:Clavaminate synthase-like protein n=1 Tax=Decorospora gaudefroyi TaxID=184978 RepID=A0A6A5K6G9_9PLEO|nr:Clavaminate synthase-like protein [Decorospora gaudefroyi]